MRRFLARLSDRGRVVLPTAVRKELGVGSGDRLVFSLEDDGSVRVESLGRQVHSARGLYAHLAQGQSVTDELIEQRRAEARREVERSDNAVAH